jgi:hypothetical protein
VNGPAPRAKRDSAFIGDPTYSSAPKASRRAEAETKKGHSYKPLPKEFRHNEFTYRQIYREGDFAIYKQTWEGNEHSAAFEVIRIRQREGFQIGGRFVEPAEVYPNSEAWGVDGFTLTDKDAAFAKLMVRDNSVGNIRRRNRGLVQKIGEGSPFRSPTSRTPLDG